MTFSPRRVLPLLLSFLLGAMAPWEQAAASSPDRLAQQTLEERLAAAFGEDGVPRPIQWEVTRQGFAELVEFETQVVYRGLISPAGWVLDCPGLAHYSRQWLDRTDTLTGVYLGAFWLEHWGVECKPRQQRIWGAADVRRIGRAVGRAVEALPPQWGDVSSVYAPSQVKRYVDTLNAHGGLSVQNRDCARQASDEVRRGELSMVQAYHRKQQCPISSDHGVLEDHSDKDRYEGVALATALDTPFLGLDQWVAAPAVLAGMLGNPKAIQALLMEMAVLTPTSSVLAMREPWLAHPDVAAVIKAQDAAGQFQQTALTHAVAPVFKSWPSPAACHTAGTALRTSVQRTSSVRFLLGTLMLWPRLGVVCPEEGPTWNDRSLVEQAQARAGRQLPPGPARDVLMAPVFEGYLEEFHAQHPQSRQECVEAVLAQVKAQPDTLQQGLRRARALCPVAYQGVFAAPMEGQ